MKPTLPKGHTSCLSPSFRYTPAASTDVRATFARVREQLAKKPETDDHVTPMRQRRKP